MQSSLSDSVRITFVGDFRWPLTRPSKGLGPHRPRKPAGPVQQLCPRLFAVVTREYPKRPSLPLPQHAVSLSHVSSPDNAQSSFEIGTISHKLCQSAQTNISAQDTETNLLTHQFSKKPVALAFCTSSTTPSPLQRKISSKFSF